MTSSHPSRFYFSSSIGVGDAMASPRLFGSFSPGPSWDTWRAVVKAAFAEEMTETEVATFRSVADRNPPAKRVRELVCVVGRGGGKDSIASLIATHAAISFDPRGKLRPGERATVMCLACDRHQAGIVHGCQFASNLDPTFASNSDPS